jgi:integrase
MSKRFNFIDQTLTVRRSTTKTDAGERVIPLNASAMAAIVELYRRAKLNGGIEPSHYVFPACEHEKIDPTRPQTTWRTAWRRLTRMINCPVCSRLQDPGEVCSNNECKADISKVKSPTAGLRFHDLRHHAITELAESQASDQTIMSIAGHVSPKMLAHYSHVRLEAKRTALDALSEADKAKGYDTNNDTNPQQTPPVNPQVIEINGRPVRTRTADLIRVKDAL